jgi:hypothetical protein
MTCDSVQAQQDFLSLMAAWGSSVELRLAATPVLYAPLSKYIIKLDEIKFDGTVFELNDAIQVILYKEDGVWYCEGESFSILAFGNTAAEAVHSFSEDFVVLWEEIAEAPDDSLTQEAQDVKRNLISAVKSITKVG